MSDQIKTSGLTDEELRQRINDCRIRILEELGCEVPEILKAGSNHESA